jgi:hypothetical protein
VGANRKELILCLVAFITRVGAASHILDVHVRCNKELTRTC